MVFNAKAKKEYCLEDYRGVYIDIDRKNKKMTMGFVEEMDLVLARVGYKKLTAVNRTNPIISTPEEVRRKMEGFKMPYSTKTLCVSIRYFLNKVDVDGSHSLNLESDLDFYYELTRTRKK